MSINSIWFPQCWKLFLCMLQKDKIQVHVCFPSSIWTAALGSLPATLQCCLRTRIGVSLSHWFIGEVYISGCTSTFVLFWCIIEVVGSVLTIYCNSYPIVTSMSSVWNSKKRKKVFFQVRIMAQIFFLVFILLSYIHKPQKIWLKTVCTYHTFAWSYGHYMVEKTATN